jgi:hypothetical protein
MKFIIIATEGSLDGPPLPGNHIEMVEADSVEKAKIIFNSDMSNKVYGRRIIKICKECDFNG